jgi:hypothetical protein
LDERAREVLESIGTFIDDEYPHSSSRSTKELGDGFCKWCLMEVFELDEDRAIEAVEVEGKGECGMDAQFYLEDQLYVVQTKKGKAHSFDKVAGFIENMKQNLNGRGVTNRDAAKRAIRNILDQVSEGHRVLCDYVTDSAFSSSERKKYDNLVADNSTRLMTFRIRDLNDLVTVLHERVVDLPEPYKTTPFKIYAESAPIEFKNTLVFPAKLASVSKLVHEAGDAFFHSNIRSYLRRTKINQGIEKTISQCPERFWVFNNGITIVCKNYELEGKVVTLSIPQVVNGCQTAKTIENVIRTNTKKTRENGEAVGFVLMRVIRSVDEELKSKITQYTNSQNAVKGKDLLSLDDFNRRLRRSMEGLGYFYEVQRGSFAILDRRRKNSFKGASDFAHLAPEKPITCIPAPEAVQGYASAFLQWPHIAYGRPSSLMPFESDHYQEVFNENTPEHPEYFLLPSLVAAYSVQKLGYGHGGMGFRRYGRWFYVSVVFGTILKALRLLGIVDEEATVGQISSEQLRLIFSNKELSIRLLEFVDDPILDRYFGDSNIDDMIKEDVWNFFKWKCREVKKAVDILDQKMDYCLAKREGRELLSHIGKVLGRTD